jgi:NADH:ubiquinone oxidoreductase subunit
MVNDTARERTGKVGNTDTRQRIRSSSRTDLDRSRRDMNQFLRPQTKTLGHVAIFGSTRSFWDWQLRVFVNTRVCRATPAAVSFLQLLLSLQGCSPKTIRRWSRRRTWQGSNCERASGLLSGVFFCLLSAGVFVSVTLCGNAAVVQSDRSFLAVISLPAVIATRPQVGEDLVGNKYYELCDDGHTRRMVEYKDEIPDPNTISVLWYARWDGAWISMHLNCTPCHNETLASRTQFQQQHIKKQHNNGTHLQVFVDASRA